MMYQNFLHARTLQPKNPFSKYVRQAAMLSVSLTSFCSYGICGGDPNITDIDLNTRNSIISRLELEHRYAIKDIAPSVIIAFEKGAETRPGVYAFLGSYDGLTAAITYIITNDLHSWTSSWTVTYKNPIVTFDNGLKITLSINDKETDGLPGVKFTSDVKFINVE
jgi:hypothetical protein